MKKVTKENVEQCIFEHMESFCKGCYNEETLEAALDAAVEKLSDEEREIVGEYITDNMCYVLAWAVMKANGQDVPSLEYIRKQWSKESKI